MDRQLVAFLGVVLAPVGNGLDPSSAVGRRAVGDAASAAIPSTGKVTVDAIRVVSGGAWCSLARTLEHKTATFGTSVQWIDDGAKVTSEGGEFSCTLSGQTTLVGSQDCQFVVGAGRVRTNVTCPADKVTGQREGKGLRIGAVACAGAVLGCSLEADLTLRASPR